VATGAESVNPSTSASGFDAAQFDEGLALFITFAILFGLSTQQATAKFALWTGVAIFALAWNGAYQSGRAKQFWQALSS
jgi:hypothetical protein